MEAEEVQKLAHGTGVTLAGGITNSGLNYVSGIAISRFVGPELIGAYFLCLVWAQLASALCRLGFSDALLRFIPPARLGGEDGVRLRILKTILVLGALASLLAAIGLALALFVWGAEAGIERVLRGLLPWFLLLVPAHVLMVLMLMAVQAHQEMTPVVLVRDMLQPAVLLVATIGLIWVLPAERALVWGFGISLVIAVLAIGLRLRRIAPDLVRTPGWADLGPLFAFSVPVMFGDVSHYLYRWIDTIMISAFLELRDVGIYNAAVRTSLLIGLIFMAANAIYSTMASGYFHTGRIDRLRSALHLSTRWCITLALPIVVLFWAGGSQVLSLWGSDFETGAPALVLLVLAQLLMVPTGILAYTLIMCGRQVLELVDTLVAVGLILVLNLLLVPRFGLLGAAGSLVLANASGLCLRWVQVHRIFGFHPCDLSALKPLASAGVALAAGLWLDGPLISGLSQSLGESLWTTLISLASLGLIVLTSFGSTLWALGFEDQDRMLPGMLRAGLLGSRGSAAEPAAASGERGA